MTKLTTEVLKEIIGSYPDGSDEIECLMAKKLLAYEQAAKNPVAYMHRSGQVVTRDETSCEEVFKICCKVETPLYAAPVLPKQPELPQGFTYESGILTANFGNGDVLISDTHWPESGHAGISFAPVPQPKRPNLSDYTDLLGGSKTEDIGTLFIVKSNSAESLIAIRNKLDIAINALSPAPAQPVIPEQNDLSEKLIGLANHISSAANGIPFGWQDWADEIVTDLRSLASTAQPVSEPYKLPELNDELIEILGRPNFTCAKLAECLRNCGQDIKRKSEYEQAAVLHVLLNLYIKHGNDWRKHAEEAFTPAVAQENE